MYRHDRLGEVLKRFKEAKSVRNRDLACRFDLSRQSFELSCKFFDLTGGDGFKRVRSQDWEAFVEECRQVLGDWPSVLFAANRIAQMPRGRGSRLRHADLANRDRAICDRIRTAKSQAKNADWWREQLRQASDAIDRFLFHLTFWTWVPSEIVFEMADDVGVKLEEMSVTEWSTLLSFLPSAFQPFYFDRARDARENQSLPRNLNSQRLVFLLGTKAPTTYGRAIFLDHFRNESVCTHDEMASFRQFWALETALASVLSWQSALSIIRATYKQGASHYMMGFLFRPHATLPGNVVDTILARAGSYPVAIWELAEGIASARARRAIRPVAKVAREERWFAS